MSPVERSGHHAGRAALVALVGVIVLFGTLGLVTLALKAWLEHRFIRAEKGETA